MPTQVNACDCLNAIGDFMRAVMEYTEGAYEQPREGSAIQFVHDALTKAEKTCGHNRASSAREFVRDMEDRGTDMPAYNVEPHDLAAALALIDLANELKHKGGCTEAR